ncbi:IS30 family transposase [Microbacterium horticulturae]|uniref:IS30 family transposase n=1 Tax=Microbacterium horticulturae TaxID=3028316 RepID=UPI003D186675
MRVRAAALGLLLDGVSAREVAGRLGLRAWTVGHWAKLAGMQLRRGRYPHVDSARPPLPPASGHGHRLSGADRVIIEARYRMGVSMRAIAREVGVSGSTISRELERASMSSRGHVWYDARVADHRAQALRARPKPCRLDSEPELRGVVVEKLKARLSPEQVAGRLRLEFPDRPEMHVSHETIYQALYVQGAGALRHELKVEKALRSGRTSRVPQSKLPRRSSRPWLEGAMIDARPAEAADRAVPGHWEGDLVVGPECSGIVTLVERAARFTLIGRLPGVRDSETVTGVLQSMIESLPDELVRTITWDQGTEMAQHALFSVRTQCPVFFCDPHSPWQRPTNENTNGLIRDFFPKGTNFNTITDEQLAEVQRLLNDRPRKVLEFYTPREKLTERITGVALTP